MSEIDEIIKKRESRSITNDTKSIDEDFLVEGECSLMGPIDKGSVRIPPNNIIDCHTERAKRILREKE
tara:strand:- start:723 stop:926 length:204 start_codon:yes stop_codon:yes gene_type:complete